MRRIQALLKRHSAVVFRATWLSRPMMMPRIVHKQTPPNEKDETRAQHMRCAEAHERSCQPDARNVKRPASCQLLAGTGCILRSGNTRPFFLSRAQSSNSTVVASVEGAAQTGGGGGEVAGGGAQSTLPPRVYSSEQCLHVYHAGFLTSS